MQENRHPETAKTIFTIGAGQLGLMLAKAAKTLGISFDYQSLEQTKIWLDSLLDSRGILVSFEQEHVDEAILRIVQEKGIECFPSLENFLLLRNKFEQKKWLHAHSIPTSAFAPAKDWADFSQHHAGTVLKTGRGGYDGQGVWNLAKDGQAQGQKSKLPIEELLPQLQDAYVEAHVDFQEELASVVCRSRTGEIVVYPTVKTIQRQGVCREVEYSQIFAATPAAQAASAIAKTIVEELKYVGVLAVELFSTPEGLLVNEIAPRVHNSGHFTIDVCQGSQFENHLRAGLGLPLSSASADYPAALMVNLLWPPAQQEFAPLFTRLTCGEPWPENAKLHWYGKSEIRPLRKMGHFTVYGNSLQECRAQAQQLLASRWA